MHDPRTLLLTITNIALGLAAVLLVLGVVAAVLCEFVARLRRRHTLEHQMDRELQHLFHNSRPSSRIRH